MIRNSVSSSWKWPVKHMQSACQESRSSGKPFSMSLQISYSMTGYWKFQFSSVQSFSRVWLFATPWTAACQASLSITNSWSLLKPMSIELVMPSSHLILCHPLLLLPTIPPSIRVFSNESALRIRWPKYLEFTFNISLSNEHTGLISFRMDWLDLLAVQGTLKNRRIQITSFAAKRSHQNCISSFQAPLSSPKSSAWIYEIKNSILGRRRNWSF